MNIRPLDPAIDYPRLTRWWEIRKICIPLPVSLLPRGYMAEDGPVPIAAAFLYLDVDGKWAMTEWLTTNPAVAHSRSLVEGVHALLAHMEDMAREQGCTSIISMVAPGTGEERLMQKIGYETSEGPAHKMYGKVLTPKPVEVS